MSTGLHTITDSRSLLQSIRNGDWRMLARSISWIENEASGYTDLLRELPAQNNAKIIGITGPPGSGKSTLTDQLIGAFIHDGKKVAVLCVDPSSPFHFGALLGDRIRMSGWYNHPDVFIRSMATRGSLGGLHPKIIEVSELLKASGFDYIIVETVGVGQSEVEIAGLADTTVVVLVPEGGDEIQSMKAGLMEIADIFVVNKCDRPGADLFVKNLRNLVSPGTGETPTHATIVETIASQKKGIDELANLIKQHRSMGISRKSWLLAERAYQLIVQKRLHSVSKKQLAEEIKAALDAGDFNLYSFAESYG
jgi:LAO/AO transport system kinase